jgi:NhaP-type Na+/H+ or K+/H+ antiporter
MFAGSGRRPVSGDVQPVSVQFRQGRDVRLGKLMALAKDHGWTSEVSEQITILALALLAYQGSVVIGGNGFVAAFAGGILFGAATKRRLGKPVQFTETLGLSATFLVWSVFGALFLGNLFTHALSVQPVIYALLSLTVIRMVPVALAVIGTRLRPTTVAFMGWFGPRGLASVVFTLLALEEIEHAEGGGMLLQTVTWTVLLSVVLHGISASPLAARYGAHIAKLGDVPEKASASEPQIRLRDLAGRHQPKGQQRQGTP